MSHEEKDLMLMPVPTEYRDLLRRIQNTPDMLRDRAAMQYVAEITPRGNTDESEHRWRVIQYKAAAAMLALASDAIQKAVEGGMDSKNCNPQMFLALALTIASGGATDMPINPEGAK